LRSSAGVDTELNRIETEFMVLKDHGISSLVMLFRVMDGYSEQVYGFIDTRVKHLWETLMLFHDYGKWNSTNELYETLNTVNDSILSDFMGFKMSELVK
jgi:hypothetical protein